MNIFVKMLEDVHCTGKWCIVSCINRSIWWIGVALKCNVDRNGMHCTVLMLSLGTLNNSQNKVMSWATGLALPFIEWRKNAADGITIENGSIVCSLTTFETMHSSVWVCVCVYDCGEERKSTNLLKCGRDKIWVFDLFAIILGFR